MIAIDRIRQLAAMGFVVAAGVCLDGGPGVQVARAQAQVPGATAPSTQVPKGLTQFGPNHQMEEPGFGIPTVPVMPNVGIDPVLPGPASPHSRTPTSFFPMVPDSRLSFGSALAADSVGIGGFSGFGGLGYGGLGYGGLGYGGVASGGIGYGGYGYGSYGYPGSGVSTSLPPMREYGPGSYLAGNPLNPAAGNAGQVSRRAASEDAFDDAANGRPSPTRSVPSHRAKSSRRSTVRKPAAQPASKVEARGTDAAPSRPETAVAPPQQASKAGERSSAVKSEETPSPPRRSMLGSPR